MLPTIKVRHSDSDMPVALNGSGTCRLFSATKKPVQKIQPYGNCRKPFAKWLWVADRVQLQIPAPIGNAQTEIDGQQTNENACSNATSFCFKACTPPPKPWIKSECSGVIASTPPIILSIVWIQLIKHYHHVHDVLAQIGFLLQSLQNDWTIRFSSLQNRAMLKQHPTAASTQAMGAPFLQCRWQLHWGGPRWIAEWQSWGAQSLTRHLQWYQILQNGIHNCLTLYDLPSNVPVAICGHLCIISDSGIIPHAMNFLSPVTCTSVPRLIPWRCSKP